MGSIKAKIGGAWQTATAPYLKTSGSWGLSKSIWLKVDETWRNIFLQGGLVDQEFIDYTSSHLDSGSKFGIAAHSDGRVVFSGNYYNSGVKTSASITRLNSDGSLDTEFASNVGTGFPAGVGAVYQILLQPDDKYVVVGSFGSWNGNSSQKTAIRLNSDGTIDSSFSTAQGTGFLASSSTTVRSAALQSDGKIIMVGNFTSFNGTTATRIARLNSDGSLDTAFNSLMGSGLSGTPNCVLTQPDNKILVGGAFSTLNGVSVNRFVRLLSTGEIDYDFLNYGGSGLDSLGTVNAIALQPDLKIALVGNMISFNGTSSIGAVRLSPNGSLDNDFSTNLGSGFSPRFGQSVAVQTDGKILIGTSATSLNGTSIQYFVRLNNNGTIDTSFMSNLGAILYGYPYRIVVQSDGKILLGGENSYMSNNYSLLRIGGGIAG